MDWEAAFIEQYQDACVGRLLRGILHNLNGTNQAFSLQVSLFRSMFSQAEKVLQEVESTCPEPDCDLSTLRGLLRKRELMVAQMEEKVETSQRIVARILPLAQHYQAEQGCEVPLARIVDLELEILAADSFFKHKIAKTVDLDPALPVLRRHCVEMHAILYALLDNALIAVRDSPQPAVRLEGRGSDDSLVVEVHDSGPGVKPDLVGRIFEPFVSTREGALGVGLYLARKNAAAMGGTIEYGRETDGTCFTLTVPLSAVA